MAHDLLRRTSDEKTKKAFSFELRPESRATMNDNTLPKSSVGIEQAGLVRVGGVDIEMPVSEPGSHAAAWRAVEKPNLNQVRFDNLFD